jgi:tRNA A37 threonylcarbamoyladenosine dehydratase
MNDNVKTRFGGIARLYGEAGLYAFQKSHVAVVGIGGVGSWAAEALARSGIGEITLIDLDDICVTNTNRQVHALSSTVNHAKVDVMKARIADINPECKVHVIEDFVTAENVVEYISENTPFVIEATDSIKAKAAIVAHCKRKKLHVVTVGGAGGQIDPTQITTGDLAKTIQDPLAAKLRSELRRFYNFSKNPKRRFGIQCVYSTEQLRYPMPDGTISNSKSTMDGSTRLDCASGFGSISTVTSTFGMFAVSLVLKKIADSI